MIFDFLTNKKQSRTFAPLVTDMHCHLLPGVDDGSSNMQETIECLKALASVGYQKVFLTPHFQANYPNVEEDIQKRFDALKKQITSLNDNALPEVVAVSGEYRFDPRFARRPGIDNVLPLPGKKLLCEFSLHYNDYMPIDIFSEYIKLGYTLILAHPERYPYLGIHSDEIVKMKEIGIKFQINVLSLNGFYGESAQRKGFEYIESGMVEYLGTDTHNMRYANALKETANNKSVQKIMKSHTFLNDKL
jgi:tyrosine-protein phosphatase YwqE